METKLDRDITEKAIAWLEAKIKEYEAKPVTPDTTKELEHFKAMHFQFSDHLAWLKAGNK